MNTIAITIAIHKIRNNKFVDKEQDLNADWTRTRFLGVDFDRLSFEQAVGFVRMGVGNRPFRYVVTPNVDHIVRINDARDAEIHAAYADADLCLCDSRVMTALASLRGLRLPTVTGSDLVATTIGQHVQPGNTVTLIGGDDDILVDLRRLLPHATVIQFQPPTRMLADPAAMATTVNFVIDHPADLILLAIGSPQQEIVAHRVAATGRAVGTALCIGAGIEFLTGHKRRAPVLLRRMGLEWLFRLCSEPRRLWRRYLLHSPRIFLLLLRSERSLRRLAS